MLNEQRELKAQKSVPHRDFYNVRKVGGYESLTLLVVFLMSTKLIIIIVLIFEVDFLLSMHKCILYTIQYVMLNKFIFFFEQILSHVVKCQVLIRK